MSPNAPYASYAYDMLNRATQIGENGATSWVGLLASYTYDDHGWRTNITWAGGGGAPTVIAQTIGNLIAGNIESQPQGQSSGNGSTNPLQALWNGIENVGGAIVNGVEQVGGAIVNGVETVATDVGNFLNGSEGPAPAATPNPSGATTGTTNSMLAKLVPQAIAEIGTASQSSTLNQTQQNQLSSIYNLLNSGNVKVGFTNDPSEGGSTSTNNGVSTIILNPASVENPDGTPNVDYLAELLVHEGQHALDQVNWGIPTETSPAQEQRMEIRAYTSQASFDESINLNSGYFPGSNNWAALANSSQIGQEIFTNAKASTNIIYPSYSPKPTIVQFPPVAAKPK